MVIWRISDEKAGHVNQLNSLVDALQQRQQVFHTNSLLDKTLAQKAHSLMFLNTNVDMLSVSQQKFRYVKCF